MFARRLAVASWTLAAVASLAPIPASFAQPDPAGYGVYYATLGNNASSPGALITIHPVTGAGTLVGPTGIVGALDDPGVPALAIRSTGEMFAMDIGSPSNLYRIDATTGAATLVAATSLASPPAIAFDGSDVLWAADASGSVYTLNETTGASTLVGSSGVFIKGMSFDPLTGILWASDASGGVFTVDRQTGAATLVGNTGLPSSPDIFFDALGVLYASSGGGFNINNLITIDKVTGAGQVVGSIGYASVAGMATRIERFLPVALQSYAASWVEDHVEVTWQLLDIEAPLSFRVFRAQENGAFVWIDDASIRESRGTYTFVDAAAAPGASYRYRVVVLEDGEPITEFEASVSTPFVAAVLGQNFPNPFNPRTTIEYTVSERAIVSIEIFDASGARIRAVDQGVREVGSHRAEWDGRDGDGRPVASGVYFYRLAGAGKSEARKMVLIK